MITATKGFYALLTNRQGTLATLAKNSPPGIPHKTTWIRETCRIHVIVFDIYRATADRPDSSRNIRIPSKRSTNGLQWARYKCPQDIHTLCTVLPGNSQGLPSILVVRRAYRDTHQDLRVRRDQLLKAFCWLRDHNRFFTNVQIDRAMLATLTEDGNLDKVQVVMAAVRLDEKALQLMSQGLSPDKIFTTSGVPLWFQQDNRIRFCR